MLGDSQKEPGMNSASMMGPHCSEGLIGIGGRAFYAIPNVDQLKPFLMSVISAGDRWMFVSSEGSLTAGRRDSSRALFPYETDDRLHDARGITGPVTSVLVDGDAGIWRPFRSDRASAVTRRLAKSVAGNSVIFEEDHPTVPLTFSYQWSSCDRFGFVRRSTMHNRSATAIKVDIADGVLNVMPWGVEPGTYQRMQNLTHAYKRSEIVAAAHGVAVYSVESRVADRPEPTEALRCTTIWSRGVDSFTVSLDPSSLIDFETGRAFRSEQLLTGRAGAYLVSGTIEVPPHSSVQWDLVGDVGLDQPALVGLLQELQTIPDLRSVIDAALDEETDQLIKLMATADALQCTGDSVACANHVANVTYNTMRGGLPLDGYSVDTDDFSKFLLQRNRQIHDSHQQMVATLPRTMHRDELLSLLESHGDPQLIRLGLEYLPFGFSRRHGDPSRPWNEFSIRVTNDDGEPIRNYEGNWRDIFQNWEALCSSFPEYLLSVISVFVNASTPDGFNPYRISRAGIDWEVPEPDDPWSNIGYWGDHQIAYLLALLEASDNHQPGEIRRLLNARLFSFADVPYRIAPYASLVRDPKATIGFDVVAHERSLQRATEVGGDGRLLWSNGDVFLTTLAEKLILPALAKMANFVAGGGIWMNTQRPEWNDANNALVGNGLSMVTLYQLRVYLHHLRELGLDDDRYELSAEVAEWLNATSTALLADVIMQGSDGGDARRRQLMDSLGMPFSEYRTTIAATGFTERVSIAWSDIRQFCDRALTHIDATIADAQRPDGLYHSYNVLRLYNEGGVNAAMIEHLPEMLEGQVAVMSSGVLSPNESADLVDRMFDSRLYRSDVESFVLYPATRPNGFLAKNVIPADAIDGNPLLAALVVAGDRSIVVRDAEGHVRFRADLDDRAALRRMINELVANEQWGALAQHLGEAVVTIYEDVFDHRSYTGRSRSMYAYEGIGSVYWHMVAKLLVSIQAAIRSSESGNHEHAITHRLVSAYWRVRRGSGRSKSAAQWGAIPTDPYSHSPAHAGAQQPGMTGLAKEEVLARLGELGVLVSGGCITFSASLVRHSELLESPQQWSITDIDGAPLTLDLKPGTYAFTLCQTPVVVQYGDLPARVEVTFRDGRVEQHSDLALDPDVTAAIFRRNGTVAMISVALPAMPV